MGTAFFLKPCPYTPLPPTLPPTHCRYPGTPSDDKGKKCYFPHGNRTICHARLRIRTAVTVTTRLSTQFSCPGQGRARGDEKVYRVHGLVITGPHSPPSPPPALQTLVDGVDSWSETTRLITSPRLIIGPHHHHYHDHHRPTTAPLPTGRPPLLAVFALPEH